MAADENANGVPDVSVVVCAYSDERWDDLVAAVRSLARQTVAPREVVVVVDHNPGLLARAREELPGIVAIANEEPRGLSGARNSGLARASGAVVAFLDDDALAAPDWIERLGAPYADERVIAVGGSVVPLWATRRPRAFPQEFDWVVGCSYRGLPRALSPVRNLIGANMSFRRRVFDEVGGFRTGIGRVGTLPVGCEETELCIRARHRDPGAIVLFDPEARVLHRVPAARTRWRYFASRCWSEGISKAIVAGIAGRRDALSSERAYAARALTSGFLRGLGDVMRGDAAGAGRAAAIAAGLFITTAGYAVGALRRPRLA